MNIEDINTNINKIKDKFEKNKNDVVKLNSLLEISNGLNNGLNKVLNNMVQTKEMVSPNYCIDYIPTDLIEMSNVINKLINEISKIINDHNSNIRMLNIYYNFNKAKYDENDNDNELMQIIKYNMEVYNISDINKIKEKLECKEKI